MHVRRIASLLLITVLILSITAPAPLVQAQATESRTATATCTAGSTRYDDVRFVLSAPAEVSVRYDSVDGTWWIRQDPAGPMLIAVSNGSPSYSAGVQGKPGMPDELKVNLPAGSFILHTECSGPAPGRSASVTITLPAAPAPPPGPHYYVTARASAEANSAVNGWVHGYNDRIFILTTRQVVTFAPGPGAENESTGRISDGAGTIWWAIERGTIRSRSTLDLPAGTYCLHVDWPKSLPVQTSDQWTLQIVGPTQPTGNTTTVRGQYDPMPMGNDSKYQDVAFALGAPQVVHLRPEASSATYWIVDTAGVRWYYEINGVTQSCSSWVGPPSGTAPGRPKAEPPGVLLPAGTYLLHVDAGGIGVGKYGVSVDFIGSTAANFPWPSDIRCPCAKRSSLTLTGGTLQQRVEALVQAIQDGIEEQTLAARRSLEEGIQKVVERALQAWCQSITAPAAVVLLVAYMTRRRRKDQISK